MWAQASTEAIGMWIGNYMIEIGEQIVYPIPLRVDNSICVAQAKGNVSAKGSRHYMRRVEFVEGNEKAKLFDTRFVDTGNMSVDAMGKWTPIAKYKASRAHWLNLGAQVQAAAEK